jgi:hypothetical protein
MVEGLGGLRCPRKPPPEGLPREHFLRLGTPRGLHLEPLETTDLQTQPMCSADPPRPMMFSFHGRC